MVTHKPDLSDPRYAAFVWARFFRLMRWMTAAAVLTVIIVLGVLWHDRGPLPIHLMIGTALGVFFTILLTAALMGLVFLSSGSGHDEVAGERFEEDR